MPCPSRPRPLPNRPHCQLQRIGHPDLWRDKARSPHPKRPALAGDRHGRGPVQCRHRLAQGTQGGDLGQFRSRQDRRRAGFLCGRHIGRLGRYPAARMGQPVSDIPVPCHAGLCGPDRRRKRRSLYRGPDPHPRRRGAVSPGRRQRVADRPDPVPRRCQPARQPGRGGLQDPHLPVARRAGHRRVRGAHQCAQGRTGTLALSAGL